MTPNDPSGSATGNGPHPGEIRLTGEAVTVSYVANPVIGRGQFLLENRSDSSVTVSVDAAWMTRGDRATPFHDTGIYDKDRQCMVSPGDLIVEAGESRRFFLTFPRVEYEPSFGESVAVGLRARVNAALLEASSPIVYERRELSR